LLVRRPLGACTRSAGATLDEVATITAEMPEAYQAFILMAAWLALRYDVPTELRRKDIIL
jgi:hypothetical protein